MNQLPQISVIIPAYNSQNTLSPCLRSVLNQSYPLYEVIVVDNGSTDKTKQIIEEFMRKDKRIRYVWESLRSRGAARNRGVKEAKGKIIVMTDSDCLVPQDWLEKITEPIIHKNEHVVIGNEEDWVGNYWTRLQQEAHQIFLRQHVEQEPYINHIDTKNFAIHKECFNVTGSFNRDIGSLEDFELKIRLRKKGYRIYFLKELKVKHRHSTNFFLLFQKRMDQGFWAAKIYLLHKNLFKDNPEEEVKSMNFFKFMAFFCWVVLFAFKNKFDKTLYELICGVAWRTGIIKAFINDQPNSQAVAVSEG